MTTSMRDYINIIEGDPGDIAHDEQVAAISQFLVDRSSDKNGTARMPTESFIHLANEMGLSLTTETLMDMVENGKLSDIIKDVNEDEITFRGQEEVEASKMDTDKARETIKKMAKRQAKKKK